MDDNIQSILNSEYHQECANVSLSGVFCCHLVADNFSHIRQDYFSLGLRQLHIFPNGSDEYENIKIPIISENNIKIPKLSEARICA